MLIIEKMVFWLFLFVNEYEIVFLKEKCEKVFIGSLWKILVIFNVLKGFLIFKYCKDNGFELLLKCIKFVDVGFLKVFLEECVWILLGYFFERFKG